MYTEENNKFIETDANKLDIVDNNINKLQNPSKKLTHSTNFNNLLLSCVKNEEYCFTMLDYLKKLYHFSQIDYFQAYSQLLYCFRPKEM